MNAPSGNPRSSDGLNVHHSATFAHSRQAQMTTRVSLVNDSNSSTCSSDGPVGRLPPLHKLPKLLVRRVQTIEVEILRGLDLIVLEQLTSRSVSQSVRSFIRLEHAKRVQASPRLPGAHNISRPCWRVLKSSERLSSSRMASSCTWERPAFTSLWETWHHMDVMQWVQAREFAHANELNCMSPLQCIARYVLHSVLTIHR
jgi:hypothetical protein